MAKCQVLTGSAVKGSKTMHIEMNDFNVGPVTDREKMKING